MLKFKKDTLPTEPKERLAHLYRLQELLKLYYNKKGTDYRTGKITNAEWRSFSDNWYFPRSELICDTINACKNAMRLDTTIEVNPDIIEDA